MTWWPCGRPLQPKHSPSVASKIMGKPDVISTLSHKYNHILTATDIGLDRCPSNIMGTVGPLPSQLLLYISKLKDLTLLSFFHQSLIPRNITFLLGIRIDSPLKYLPESSGDPSYLQIYNLVTQYLIPFNDDVRWYIRDLNVSAVAGFGRFLKLPPRIFSMYVFK